MSKEKTYRGYAVGQEIVTFKHNSWQEAAHAKGMRFFEPYPPGKRLERTPTEAEQLTTSAGELVVLATCSQQEGAVAEQTKAIDLAIAS